MAETVETAKFVIPVSSQFRVPCGRCAKRGKGEQRGHKEELHGTHNLYYVSQQLLPVDDSQIKRWTQSRTQSSILKTMIHYSFWNTACIWPDRMVEYQRNKFFHTWGEMSHISLTSADKNALCSKDTFQCDCIIVRTICTDRTTKSSVLECRQSVLNNKFELSSW